MALEIDVALPAERVTRALDRAVETFQAALDLYPEHAESWHNLGQAHIQRQDWDAARDAFVRGERVITR